MGNNDEETYHYMMAIFWGCSLHGFAQTSDEKIAEAINNSDCFALDSLYRTEPKDSI